MLQNDAAVFRTQETLENGCKEIDDCVASFEDVGIQDRSMVWNTDLCETLELENLLTNAAVTMHSAEARKVSFQLSKCHCPQLPCPSAQPVCQVSCVGCFVMSCASISKSLLAKLSLSGVTVLPWLFLCLIQYQVHIEIGESAQV